MISEISTTVKLPERWLEMEAFNIVNIDRYKIR